MQLFKSFLWFNHLLCFDLVESENLLFINTIISSQELHIVICVHFCKWSQVIHTWYFLIWCEVTSLWFCVPEEIPPRAWTLRHQHKILGHLPSNIYRLDIYLQHLTLNFNWGSHQNRFLYEDFLHAQIWETRALEQCVCEKDNEKNSHWASSQRVSSGEQELYLWLCALNGFCRHMKVFVFYCVPLHVYVYLLHF